MEGSKELLYIILMTLILVTLSFGVLMLRRWRLSTFRRLKQLVIKGEKFFDDAWLNYDKKDKMKNYLKEHGYKHTKLEDTRNIVGISKIEFVSRACIEYIDNHNIPLESKADNN